MQLKLSFSEIQSMIAAKTGKQLPMIYGGPHTVRISYEVNVLFKSTSVGLDITIDEIVDGNTIYLSHSGGMAIDMALKTALGRFKDQPGADLFESLGDSRYRLCLGKNPQAAQMLDRIELQDIHFDEQSVMIDFVPRGM